MRLAVRLAVVAVCLLALVGLGVHYGATDDENWPHPTGDQLRDKYDVFVGDRVLVFGDVQSVEAETNTIVVHVTDSADAVAAELTIHGVDDPVAPGGTVQIVGVLEADRTMTAERTVVVNRDASAVYYKLGTSVVGVLVAVGYFLRYWRPAVRRVGFEPRSGSPSSAQQRAESDSATTSEVHRDG